MTPFEEAALICKNEIRDRVNAALQEFRTKTGLTPSAVDLRIIEVTTYGDPIPQHELATVVLRFSL